MKKTGDTPEFDVVQAAGVLPAVLDALEIGLAVVSASGRIVLANDALRRFLGYDDEQLTGVNRKAVTFPDDAEESAAAYRQILSGRRRVTAFEKRYVRRDGEVVWGRLAMAALPDASGQVSHVVAACQDITRARDLETKLQNVARLLGEYGMFKEPDRGVSDERLAVKLAALSRREAEVVRLLVANRRVGSIAKALGLTPRTVRNHLVSAYRKLGVHSQSALVDLFSADDRPCPATEPAATPDMPEAPDDES